MSATTAPLPRTGSPSADFRLLLPAASAWVVTAVLLPLEPGSEALVLPLAGVAVLAAVLLLIRPGFPPRPGLLLRRGVPHRRGAAVALAAVLLTGAAAAIATPLHTADLHRGPLRELARAAEHAPPRAPGTPAPVVEVELTVAGDPKVHASRGGTTGGQTLLTVKAVADRVTLLPDGHATRTHTPVTVMVRGPESEPWLRRLPSERLAVEAEVRPAGEGYDTESAALLAVHGPPRQVEPPSLPQRIAGRLREGLRTASEGLPSDARGLLPGLVVGDTSRLSDDLVDDFRATDLVHLVAVSGANLAIVLGVLLGAPGQAGTPERRGLAALLGLSLRTSALLGTALTLAFVTVCRPEPSVLRAAGTGLIGMLALATGRPRQAVPALAGAVLVLVLLDPFLAQSFGFLLSVLATAGLLILGPHWAESLRARRWPHHLAGALAAAAAAQALCSPVTVVLSGHISLVAIPCNLLAELAVAPATLLGFGVLILQPFLPGPARLLAEPAGVPASWLAFVARRGAELPGGQLSWPGGWFGTATVALVVLAACWTAPLLLPRRPEPGGRVPVRRRWARMAVTGALLVVLLAVLLRPPQLTRIATGWPPPGWRLVMCDVGQGDMLALAAGAPDSAVVIDAGPDPNAADRCLRELGITTVPLLVLTHFHADHVEGVPGVLRGRRVGAVEGTTLDDPPGEAARVAAWTAGAGAPLLRAGRGERRSAGPGLTWEVLWPASGTSVEAPGANNASVALLVSLTGGMKMALLGDLEPPAQSALLGHLGRVDVLKVAHHGSAHQDWDLTGALRPRLALISCGEDNPYGHPSMKTVDRLRGLGATVLRTDRAGDIAVTGDSPATLGVAVNPHPTHGTHRSRAHSPKHSTPHASPGRTPGTPRAPPA
ncbi:ComEC/Rec2 family competence protein [Kitasatospora sp. SUK 42]|uniref:ComEC/Rec2 family competence protein n=1 Tax=Kitasatospora sp. SUK 42 TaxID=1588882 RepID=UPI0018CB8866|nr:ComEC/Rec2 family competence protein [Kitasatospora sp. SUK 42]MBV2153941.1 ComEC/Rec2 family competence protein [Kitasatospora sp. SUK 42]